MNDDDIYGQCGNSLFRQILLQYNFSSDKADSEWFLLLIQSECEEFVCLLISFRNISLGIIVVQ